MIIKYLYITLLCILTSSVYSQTQIIRGTISDISSGLPIAFANVYVLDTNPALGAVSDEDGQFIIESISIGRYDIQASFVGYESTIKKNIEVTSSKAVEIEIVLKESINTLGEIIVKPNIDKENALNPMAMISARMISVEEANRYAGGFDDPARLVTSFAGVSSGVNSNGIAVRGNAPKGLQWKLEGIEIPNPNHFADLVGFGGGALTALSSQLLSNSDFLTGAFPSEYNNALSGVLDLKMRKGNNDDREHTFQIGALGIDISSEGPFKKGKDASYLFNYRYSTFGLVGKLTGAEEGIEYQDASFKLNFPTKKAGVFSFWGIGLLDKIIISEEIDTSIWEYKTDGERYVADQYMVATGLTNKLILNKQSYLQTTIGYTTNNTDWKVSSLNKSLSLQPLSNVQTTNSTLVLNTTINTKFDNKHSTRAGLKATQLSYKTLIQNRMNDDSEIETLSDENGNSYLFSAFSSSNYRFNDAFTIILGVNAQLFTLNSNYTVEPRFALKWDVNSTHQFGIAYGLHSRLEKLNYYFTKNENGVYNNKEMDFAKSHHFIFSYSNKISDSWLLKIEPYYQLLFDVPVIDNNYYSFTNQLSRDDWFTNDLFTNSGKGKNYGVDITLEKYFTEGFYMMTTASIFNSQYTGGDNIWRNTRFNKNYLFNFLTGKEWKLGSNDQKVFGINLRLTTQGGDRYIPFNEQESINSQEVIYDYDNAYEAQFDPNLVIHFTINYKINKSKTTHEFALKMINATAYGDFQNFEYNLQTKQIDEVAEVIVIPNLSYKMSF